MWQDEYNFLEDTIKGVRDTLVDSLKNLLLKQPCYFDRELLGILY